MSQFYDLASLVVIPSGYKASTIYAQKPLTTDGQLSFSRASTATRVNASGLIEAVASNVPRLDYLGSSCPRLLLEPQRTNLALYSEQFDNAYYGKTNCTVTANNATSPDGSVNADTLTSSAAGSFFSASVTFSDPSTASFYVKYVSQRFVQIFSGASGGAYANFDLVNGVVGSKGADASSSSITSVGNGWFRIVTTLTGIIGSSNFRLAFIASATSGWGESNPDSNKSIQIWGAQFEAGSYATSYVKTEAAAVTRVADAASKTGISSLIGQTEGTLFAEFFVPSIATAGSYTSFTLSDGTSSNVVDMAYYPDGRIQAAAIVGGSVTVNIDLPSYGLTAGTHKFAFAYKLNDYVLYVDGFQRGTDTSSAVPAMSKFDLFGGLNATSNYNQALLFKTRLTNAQLAELTTL
jgi:hypothetical protein